jgi:small subunit ribosomal protein S4
LGVPIFGYSKSVEKRNYPPGQHGPKSRRKVTDYALGLLEKQKLRYYYGLQEKQFRRIYETAARRRGVTGEQMLQLLETRLDSIVYHLGFGSTRPAARQMIGHGHVKVNGRKVDVASFAVKANDVIEVRANAVSRQLANKGLELSTSRPVPGWIVLNKEGLKGTVVRMPSREDIQPIANEQAVVEFYSR